MPLYSKVTHIESSIFSEIPHISHAFSYRSQGDMRGKSTVATFLDSLNISNQAFLPKQVHGDQIIINPPDCIATEGDGVAVFRDTSIVQSIGVITADCVPLLFTDVEGSCIAAVHAGWKGVHKNIVGALLAVMYGRGIVLDSIRVVIGPHIGPCCYTVPESRTAMFEAQYPTIREYAYMNDGIWHLDIGKIILIQLTQAGIPCDHIDTGIFCTSCQHDSFFSFRKDEKEQFGETLAVIGFKQ